MMRIENLKKENGKFAKKAFIQCKTQDEFDSALSVLVDQGHQSSIVGGYEAGKGKILLLVPTLMQWGRIQVRPNTVTQRNKLRASGFSEVSA